ncbi:hypothetical protein V8C43DRAFT_46338 [Trichoderma afarasin]
MHALRGLWIHGWVDKMRAESAPERWLPSINGTGAFLLGPVLLSCACALRQWPKFMIACICAPGRIMHAEQRPNESPPCDTTAPVLWARVCVVIPLAMRVMMGRLFSAFPTNCGPRRCHALTHSSQPAFTSPPSSDLLILRGRTHWYGYGHGTRSTHAASYQACFPCCRSMRHRGWMDVCMYNTPSQQRYCCLSNCVAEPSRYLQVRHR